MKASATASATYAEIRCVLSEKLSSHGFECVGRYANIR